MHRMADMIAGLIKDEYPGVDRQMVFNIIMTGFSFTPVGEFFIECCRINYENYTTPFSDMYNAYVEFSNKIGYTPISKVKFSQEMKRLGAKKHRWGKGVFFTGIVLTRDILKHSKLEGKK